MTFCLSFSVISVRTQQVTVKSIYSNSSLYHSYSKLLVNFAAILLLLFCMIQENSAFIFAFNWVSFMTPKSYELCLTNSDDIQGNQGDDVLHKTWKCSSLRRVHSIPTALNPFGIDMSDSSSGAISEYTSFGLWHKRCTLQYSRASSTFSVTS